MYEIEKGIDYPENWCARKYPFAEMEIGDSFLVPIEEIKNRSAEYVRNSILGSARQKRMPGKKFRTRKLEEGIRVWRIE